MSVFSRSKPALFALGACLGTSAWFAFPFEVDDAYITARYADRLIHGLGYTFNDGPATDGVTGPLWLVPMCMAIALGAEPLWGGKLLGILCSLIAAGVCVVRARGRASGGFLAGWTSALSSASVSLSAWSVGGLETGAAVLAFTGMALATTARRRPHGLLLGASIAAAAWLRPELCFPAAACLVCTFLRDRRAFVCALGIGAASALALVIFRLSMFGDALPLSAYAKPADLRNGLSYVGSSLLRLETWLSLALVALSLRKGSDQDRMHGSIMGAHLLGCVLAGGDWMPGFRLFAPLVPLSALTLAVGGRSLGMSPRRPRGAWTRAPAHMVLGLLLFSGCLGLVRELPAVREAGQNRAQQIPRLLAALSAPQGSIMALDVGALGYLTNAPVYDLGGLVTPEVAHARGGHLSKHVDEAWVEQLRPTWLVLHSARMPQIAQDGTLLSLAGYPVERRVASMPFVRNGYRVNRVLRYSPGYFYVILGPLAPAKASLKSSSNGLLGMEANAVVVGRGVAP